MILDKAPACISYAIALALEQTPLKYFGIHWAPVLPVYRLFTFLTRKPSLEAGIRRNAISYTT